MRLKYTFYILLCLLPYLARAQSPVDFIENKGQWGNWFKYKATTRRGDVLLEQHGFRYILSDARNREKMDSSHHGLLTIAQTLKFHVYTLTFEGANNPAIAGEKRQQNYYNYYLGNDPAKWKSGIHPYLNINYNKLYDGIDMTVSSEHDNIVYDFLVHPNARAGDIKLKFDGQEHIAINKDNLVITTSVGDVTEMKPYAYQYINDVRTEVPCNYHLEGNTASFTFPNDYDHSKLLVVDPTVVFSTLTGSTADNWGYTATYDNQGNFYAGGLVNAEDLGTSFPVSPGAFQTTFGGGVTLNGGFGSYAADISIIKYNPTGTNRIYATYLGGAGNEHAHSMIVDTGNNLIVVGRTLSTNYPVTSNAYSTVNKGGWDIVLTKFNADGTALLGSTYLGGTGDDGVNFDSTETGYGQLKYNYGDDSRSEVQIDHAGNIYIAGCTNSGDFPTTSTAISSTLKGVQDGIVAKFNPTLTSLTWSTYIGGTGYDAGYVLAFDNTQQHLYVAGGTNSTDFPTTSGSWQTSYGGNTADGFVLKFLNSAPYSLTKGSYIGTSGYDQVYGVQIDNDNNVYMMGQSVGGLFPVTSGVYSNANSNQFVIKMDSNLTTDIASTVYGSGTSTASNISPVAFLVDTCNNVYISGWGGNLGVGSPSGNCNGMPITSDAYRTTTDGADFYFIVFGPALASLRYATYFGRTCSQVGYGEHVDGGTSRFDKNGIIYQAICANCGGVNTAVCPNFPTTPGVWGPTDGSFNCNEAALKIAFNIGPLSAHATATPSTHGCAPLTVDFHNTTVNGLSFTWVFGDGATSTSSDSVLHTYTVPGTYTVKLVAFNTNSCINVVDTAFLTIVVDSNGIQPGFTYQVTDSCGPFTVAFINTSQYSSTPGSAAFTQFHWNFGDGTFYNGVTPPAHNFPATGDYTVTLTMTDTTSCTPVDSIAYPVHFGTAQPVTASIFNADTLGCVPFTVTFQNSSINALSYTWDFGDGSASTSATSPTHTYSIPGTYFVDLVAFNSNSCVRVSDTEQLKIVVSNNTFTPAFTYHVTDSCNPFTAVFANTSQYSSTPGSGAFTQFHWSFGDGTYFNGANPPLHSFPDTGSYTVMLTMKDSTACKPADSVTHIVHFGRINSLGAMFYGPDTVCQHSSVAFVDSSVNATGYAWAFGDGGSSYAGTPNHTYDSTGTFTIVLIATNPGACIPADTARRTLVVQAVPIANFSFEPVVPVVNEPTVFTNLSVNATRYAWDFGDQTASAEVNPTHMYKKTGSYKVCLTARNTSTCPSVVCKQVGADIVPLADLPTGFSPNGDGKNDVLYVRGADIATMDLKIYNRWGQMVFETNDQNIGWDGTFNSKEQPIDAYGYVLNVTFGDGTSLLKKGNVTLLR